MTPPQLTLLPPPSTTKELAAAVVQKAIDDTARAKQVTCKTGYSTALQVVN